MSHAPSLSLLSISWSPVAIASKVRSTASAMVTPQTKKYLISHILFFKKIFFLFTYPARPVARALLPLYLGLDFFQKKIYSRNLGNCAEIQIGNKKIKFFGKVIVEVSFPLTS